MRSTEFSLPLGSGVLIATSSYLYSKIDDEREKFDVIDLDPYGTAVPFLDASIQGLSDGGTPIFIYFIIFDLL